MNTEDAPTQKMNLTRRLRAVACFALALCAVLSVPSAHAQSCVLCYTAVANGGAAVIRAFQFGILTLLIPTLTLFSGVFFLIYRRARAENNGSSSIPVRATVGPVVYQARRAAPGAFPTTAS
jgi:hypothetical protein